MKPPELAELEAEIRNLSEGCKHGRDEERLNAFERLASRLLHLTVVPPTGGVRLHRGGQRPVLAAHNLLSAIPLNNGFFLRLYVSLFFDDTAEGRRLKAWESSYQYQLEAPADGDHWVFRYDYLRVPEHKYSPGHLQIRGDLAEAGCLPPGRPLARVRFPTGRPTIEAVIRLLVEGFGVRTNQRREIWQPALALSEELFLDIAHRFASGPGT